MKSHKDHKKNNRNIFVNIGFLSKYIWKWQKNLFFKLAICTVVTAIIPFINILVPKFLIDELLGDKRAEILIVIVLTFLIISSTLNYLTAHLEGFFSPTLVDLGMKFDNLISEKCMEMDFKHTEDPNTLNHIDAAGKSIKNFFPIIRKLWGFLGSSIALLGYIAIVATLSPWVLLYLLLNVIIIYFLSVKVKKYEYGKKDNISEVTRKGNYIYDIMYNFAFGKDIRIFNLSQWIENKFVSFKKEEVKIQKNIKGKYLKVDIVDVILIFFREGIVYIYLIYRVLYGDLSIGNFTLYFATIAGFAGWMQKILEDIAYLNGQNLYLNDFRDFLDINWKTENATFEEIPAADTYEIEFKNVSFKYPNSERYILKNLSLKLSSGERLAIVGVNGAGKTTLIKLLTRLYEPTDGEILLNGTNIAKFNKIEYYKLFSVVFQEIKIFAFSLSENIALKPKEHIDRKKVNNCIGKAGIEEKIKSLEKGIDTSLLKILDPDGIELSGGENQKIALARALYKDGPVVILDEPTAALDPIAEYNIYKSFNDMIGHKTSIFISHRLASTRFCDAIALFENGEIKEYGTHEELLRRKGKYAEMFNVQASYYKEEILDKEGA